MPIPLFVASAVGPARLCTAANEPVWPYADSETFTSLTNIADLFETTVVEVKPRPALGNAIRATRPGLVVSARPDADEAACLYAHLTERRFAAAKDYRPFQVPHPAVVVAPQEVLTPDFLRHLYSDPKRAPGLITAQSPEALLRQTLVRAAALRLAGRNRGKRVDVRPFAEFGRIDLGEWEILGGETRRAQIRQGLENGSDLLTIFTVGDAIDAGLGPLTLCPMDRKIVGAKGTAPPCVVSGKCHRLQLPMAEALASGRLIPPEAIAARVLILHACWGIQPKGSMHDPAFGYGYRLANHDRLGAMFTTWQITLGSSADIEPLARNLAGGMPLGRALARFNYSASARRTGQVMCLLGDPDLRVTTKAKIPIFRRPPRGAGTPANEQRQLAFLAAFLNNVKPKSECQAAQTVAQHAVAACQKRAWSGQAIEASDEPAGAVMRQAVLAFLCQHATIPAYHWMNFACPVNTKDLGLRCLACGQSEREVNLRLRILGGISRTIQLCIRCGLIEDRPAKMERIRVTIERGRVCFHGVAPRGAWAAAMLLRPYGDAPVFRAWPAANNSEPVSAMSVLGQGLPEGAGQLLLFVMEGASLRVARAPYSSLN